jgi:hypothetical protein
LAALAAGTGIGPARAADPLPFDVAEVFFELNNTDGDLGIHALMDGEPWRQLEIEDPGGRGMLAVRVQGRLGRQGLTELDFESAEPTFDELAPEDFFARFPEGTYKVKGVTLEGEKLASEATVTHLLPAPPEAFVNGQAAPGTTCDAASLPEVAQPIEIGWDAVTLSHPDLGRTNEPIEVLQYEVVIEREQPPPLILSVIRDPDSTSFAVPAGLVGAGEEIKFEILVREASGNQTALESCFLVAG